jgi:hypothetical protein
MLDRERAVPPRGRGAAKVTDVTAEPSSP